jgi:hypothetical protein
MKKAEDKKVKNIVGSDSGLTAKTWYEVKYTDNTITTIEYFEESNHELARNRMNFKKGELKEIPVLVDVLNKKNFLIGGVISLTDVKKITQEIEKKRT